MNKELTIADYIKKVTVNEANFDYIKNHPEKKINGTLYEGISKAMQEYADQEKKKEAIAAMDWLRKQRPDIFYGRPTSEQLYELFNQQK